jgi:hypothetical protein
MSKLSDEELRRLYTEIIPLPLDEAALKKLISEVRVQLEVTESLEEFSLPQEDDELKGANTR